LGKNKEPRGRNSGGMSGFNYLNVPRGPEFRVIHDDPLTGNREVEVGGKRYIATSAGRMSFYGEPDPRNPQSFGGSSLAESNRRSASLRGSKRGRGDDD